MTRKERGKDMPSGAEHHLTEDGDEGDTICL
jgi:hypothetical protein